MKKLLSFSIVLLVFLYACKEDPPKPEVEVLDLAGEYAGEASIICQEYRRFSNPDRLDTVDYRLETFQDKIIVSDPNPQDSIVKIHRLSYTNDDLGLRCRSKYDMGNPEGEYGLGETLTWGYKYKYDKDWDSWIKFDDNTLSAYMLEKDVFTSFGEDSSGESYEYIKVFEYKITATRQ